MPQIKSGGEMEAFVARNAATRDEIAEELVSLAELIQTGAARAVSVAVLRDGGCEWIGLAGHRDNVHHIVMPRPAEERPSAA
jgi:hypothetical protein